MIGKLIVIGLVLFLLIGGVNAFNVEYSNPTYEDGYKIEWGNSINERPVKENITKEEWNNIFEDYRNGEINKEDAIKIIKRVKVEW